MTNRASASSCLLLSSMFLMAQAPPMLWQRALGGSWDDRAWGIAPTLDGGSIMAGRSESNDGDVSGNHSILDDTWVVKQDAQGNMQWQRCIGGTGTEEGYSIVPTSDGGYVVAGLSGSDDGDATDMQGFVDGWVMKLDAAGTLIWQRSAGGTTMEMFFAAVETTGGSWLATGRTDSNDGDVTGNHGGQDAWVVALTSAGAFTSQQCHGGTGQDELRHIINTLDGNYLAVGSSTSNDGDVSGNHGDADVWVVKMDDMGSILWQRSLGGSSTDNGMWALATPDGGYMIAATTSSSDGDVSDNNGASDFWLLKLDAAGDLLWEETYGGVNAESVRSIVPYGSGYALAGSTLSNDGDVSGLHVPPGFEDAWVVGVDAAGSILWQHCLGGTQGEWALALAPTALGQLLVAGLAGSNDGDVSGGHGGADAWVVKLDGATSGITDHGSRSLSIQPTVATISVRIDIPGDAINGELELIDARGSVARSARASASVIDLDVADLPRGLYTATLRTSTGNFTQRLVLE